MAFFIDTVFLVFLLINCSLFFALALLWLPPASFANLLLLSVVFLVLFWFTPVFCAAFYFVVLHSYGGQTLGKVFMGIRVVSDCGQSLSLSSSFLRLVGYLLSMLPLGAGFLWAVLDKRHAAWHDLLVRSHVIDCAGLGTGMESLPEG